MNTRMRNLLVAVGLFAVGLMLSTSFLRSQSARIERGNDFISVLVANKDIPAGTSATQLLSGGYVESQRVLRRDATPQALTTLDDVSKLSTSQNVYKGEQLSTFKFESRSGLNPTEQIKGNQRLISLHVRPTGTVGNLIRPGDHVDIWASGKISVQGKLEQRMLKSVGESGSIASDNFTTWLAVRDAVVLQTPQSLQGSDGGGEPGAGTKMDDEAMLWVVQVSDESAQQLLWSQANADEDGIMFALRPSDGAQNSDVTPTWQPADVS